MKRRTFAWLTGRNSETMVAIPERGTVPTFVVFMVDLNSTFSLN